MLLVSGLNDYDVVARFQKSHNNDIVGAGSAVNHHHVLGADTCLGIDSSYRLLNPRRAGRVAMMVVQAHGAHFF